MYEEEKVITIDPKAECFDYVLMLLWLPFLMYPSHDDKVHQTSTNPSSAQLQPRSTTEVTGYANFQHLAGCH
jgi:hypothetical protein